MKKVIVAILMAAMICSLTACGGNNKTGDTSSNTSASAEQADASVSAEEEAKNEPQYEAGVWTDNVYTNTSLGMTFTLPEGWQKVRMHPKHMICIFTIPQLVLILL